MTNGLCGGRLARTNQRGFTLVETLVAMTLISVLSAIAIYAYKGALLKAQNTRTIAEIRGIEKLCLMYQMDRGILPDTLNDIGWHQNDPWGNAYQYLNFATVSNGLPGRVRKDRFLVPLNSDFDLYSVGPDGESRLPLTARASWDDVLRASDGIFVGVAADF